MISLSILGCMLRVTRSFGMIKPKNHWGQTSLNPCSTVVTLEKGAHELEDYEGNKLAMPKNGLCLKIYYG
jgi:hypothetical protein